MPFGVKLNDTVFGGPVLGVLQYLNKNGGKNGGTVFGLTRYSGGRYWGFYCNYFKIGMILNYKMQSGNYTTKYKNYTSNVKHF